jgi:hypothetical protein
MVETVGDFTEFSQSETADGDHHLESTNPWEQTTTVTDNKGGDGLDAVADSDREKETKGSPMTPSVEHDLPSDAKEIEADSTIDIADSFSTPVLASEVNTENLDTDNMYVESTQATDLGEDVDDFAAASVPLQTDEIVKNSDSFGDFGSAELVDNDLDDAKQDAAVADPAPTVAVPTVSADDDNPMQQQQTTSIGDAIGGVETLHTPGSSVDHVLGSASADENVEAEGFGEFGARESTTPGGIDINTDEDGTFSAFHADPEPTEPQQVSLADGDVDFGDFDAAPTSLQNVDEGKDDDFGDFDTGLAAGETKTPSNNVDNDDFGGDFDTAMSSTEPQSQPVADQDDDEDFGDFDAAIPATETKLREEINQNDHDDFGDFDAAQPAEQSQVVDDDDDFRDFDTAQPTAQPQSAGDDDDFGDFDTAQPTAQPQSADDDDDFGDFDTAVEPGDSNTPDAGKGSGNVNSVAPDISSSADPLLQSVTAVMHRVFKFHPQEEDDDEDDDTTSTEKKELTVKELMVRCFSLRQEDLLYRALTLTPMHRQFAGHVPR